MIENPTPSPDAVCYLNGSYQPLISASVPVLDRGFIFGDGVYEVAPAYERIPFRWPEHLARIKRSLSRIGIADPLDDAAWGAIVKTLIERHPWPDQFVYIQVTRGVAKRDHAFPSGVTPTVFAMTSPLAPVPADYLANSVTAITLDDERWLNCDIKSTSLLGNVLARQAAVAAGAVECVMFRYGMLTEGSASNIWLVRDGRVAGVPDDRHVLRGIRYGLLEELCRGAGLPFELRRIAREEVLAADELIMSSATKELLAITMLDGRPVGSGKPGPLHARLLAVYQHAKAASGASAPRDAAPGKR